MKVKKYGVKRNIAALVLAIGVTGTAHNIADCQPIEAQTALSATEKSVRMLSNLQMLKRRIPLQPEIALHARAEAQPKVVSDDLRMAEKASDRAIVAMKETLGTKKLSTDQLAEMACPVEAYSERIEMGQRWQQGPQKVVAVSRRHRLDILTRGPFRRGDIVSGGMPVARL